MTTIRFDLDDVLSDFVIHWMDVHHQATGERITPKRWAVAEESEYGEKVYDYFANEDFYYDQPVKDGAVKTIRFVESNSFFFDYTIVSSCKTEDQREFDYIEQQKIEWLRDHFSEYAVEVFHLTGDGKSKFGGDVIIDDHYENLIDNGDKGALKILFDANHNRHVDLVGLGKEYNEPFMRVKNHKELQQVLKDIMSAGSVEAYVQNSDDFFYLQ